MKDFALILIVCLLMLSLFFYCIGKVFADEVHYNTIHTDCGTLHGKGKIGIWFNDDYYLIKIECE